MKTQNQLPIRSKQFGVGKEIGGATYLHRIYCGRFGNAVNIALAHLPMNFAYDVVKFNHLTSAISFIQVSDFNTADEPTVGEILTVSVNGAIKRRPQPKNPEIYHHKWLFVDDNYDGFDVTQSKQRSLAWISLDGVDRRRIGRKHYWEQHIVPRIVQLHN